MTDRLKGVSEPISKDPEFEPGNYRSPLLDVCHAAADTDPARGVPWHYGDPLVEQRRLHDGLGVVDRSDRAILRLKGPGPSAILEWLNALISNQVDDMSPGDSRVALVLNAQGHIEHQFTVFFPPVNITRRKHADPSRSPHSIYIVHPAQGAQEFEDYLRKMVFWSGVEIKGGRVATLSLIGAGCSGSGAGSADAIASLTEKLKAIAPEDSMFSVHHVPGFDHYELLIRRSHLTDWWDALTGTGAGTSASAAAGAGTDTDTEADTDSASSDADGAAGADSADGNAADATFGTDSDAGTEHTDAHVTTTDVGAKHTDATRSPFAQPTGLMAYEAERIAVCWPEVGLDLDERTVPHEVPQFINHAVHMNKGCYRGQETVARIHNLGRPPRDLVLLQLDGSVDRLPQPGDPIEPVTERKARPVGVMGSVVDHCDYGPIGLGLVKHNAVDGELRVGQCAIAVDPTTVRLAELPKAGREAVARLRKS